MEVQDLQIPETVKKLVLDSGITTLYPPQVEAIRAGALDGQNLVLASPTASGKTLVAELCAMKHIFEKGGKALYLTPLRALASEKFEQFKTYTKLKKPDGSRVRVVISTGDYDSGDTWLGHYDVIVVTNEKCDSLLRHRSDWLSSVTLVVADEIHLLNEIDRGPTLEVTLTRLMEVNPGIQVLALSATIRNATEVAEWLKAKQITTEWRPVKLVEGVYYNEECQFNDGSSVKVETVDDNPVTSLAVQVIQRGGQALVFTETRARAVQYAKRISHTVGKELSSAEHRSLSMLSEKIRTLGERTRVGDMLADLARNGVAFHHAGLPTASRKLIEDSFRERRIKVIAATPTLAAGVNLPARRVVISSYQRYDVGFGRNPISVLEYKQMAGRAGRPRYDKAGEAILIAQTADEQDYLMQSYVLSKPERIWSKLAAERVLRAHVLASVATGFTDSDMGLQDFFAKTFYAHQFGTEMISALVSKVLRYLYKEEMLEYDEKVLAATEFGKRVSELYIDPVSAVIIRNGLRRVVENITELSLLQMVCHTPDVPRYYPRSRELDELVVYAELHQDEFLTSVPKPEDDIEYQSFLGEVKSARILEAWIEEVSEDGIIEKFGFEPGDLFRLIDTVKWLLYAAFELGRLLGQKELLPQILELRERVDKGIKRELLPLARLRGIGRVRSRVLFSAGYTSLRSLRDASVEQLLTVPTFGPALVKSIKEQVGNTLKTEEWERLKRDKDWQQTSISEY